MTGGLAGPTARFSGRSDLLATGGDSLNVLVDALSGLKLSCDPADCCPAPSIKPRSVLLALPSELRSAVYGTIFRDSDNGLAILRMCQQVNMEASRMLYQRPVSFSSQSRLFAWVERSRENDLRRVRTLTLRLTDIDLSPLLDPTASRRSGGQSAWSLYQRELEQLDGALRCLPGVEHLTIVPPSRMQSSLLKGIYLSFLGQLLIRCTKLKHLTIHDSEELLKKVPGLSNISKVIFEEPAPPSSLGRSPSRQEKSTSAQGKVRDVMVKMETDEDDL